MVDALKVLAATNAWGGEPEISICSEVFDCRIIVYSSVLNNNPRVFGKNKQRTIYLHHNGFHYTPLFQKRRTVSVPPFDDSVEDIEDPACEASEEKKEHFFQDCPVLPDVVEENPDKVFVVETKCIVEIDETEASAKFQKKVEITAIEKEVATLEVDQPKEHGVIDSETLIKK